MIVESTSSRFLVAAPPTVGIVIFKEKGLHFPTNFQSIGYIEFEADDIQARTADLLKELIGFGLVRVTPT